MCSDKHTVILDIEKMLLDGNNSTAKSIILVKYPHTYAKLEKRSYTIDQKMHQFISDGFIDRYTGNKLLNPEDFPYHPHWKMNDTHIAYWELIPTIDHIYPIAKGGRDEKANWVTTSMKNNLIKSNYTLDEIHWKVYPQGCIADWDGLTRVMFELIKNDEKLMNDTYIRNWYKASKKAFSEFIPSNVL